MHECLSEDKYSETAIMGLALLASSEEIGNEMAMRLFNHILHFSKSEKKRVVPLALAILNISNPKINVMDLLSKLAYDTDTEISYRAIICLGLVGAGTNNSRLADILRKLASYYSRDNDPLLLVRLAQGLLYMGKGMLSVQPYYSERFLMSKVGMAGLVIFLTSLLDIHTTILGKYHYFIYFLSLAMYPKSLFVVLLFLFSSMTNSNRCLSMSALVRLSTWSGRPENPRQSRVSRLTPLLFSSPMGRGQNWEPNSTFQSRSACWRTL
jgi:26S proteasome regulatory subunit N1